MAEEPLSSSSSPASSPPSSGNSSEQVKRESGFCPFARLANYGLRSTPEGTRHWWAQRLTAVVLALLTPWFVIGVLAHVGQSLYAVRVWLGTPSVAAMMAVFLVFTFWHAAQGIRVVLDDYVHHETLKKIFIRVVETGCAVCAMVGVGALAMIVFASRI